VATGVGAPVRSPDLADRERAIVAMRSEDSDRIIREATEIEFHADI
jgi:hypothetical protein